MNHFVVGLALGVAALVSTVDVLAAPGSDSPAAVTTKSEPERPAEVATVPVGAFLLRWAHLLDPDLPQDIDAGAAALALVDQGRLGDEVDLERPLTEGDVVGFISQIGVQLTTLHEDRPLPPAGVDAFFVRFGEFLGGEQGAALVFARIGCDATGAAPRP